PQRGGRQPVSIPRSTEETHPCLSGRRAMKRETQSAGKTLDQFFKRTPKPSQEQMELSRRRIQQHLNLELNERTAMDAAYAADGVPKRRSPFRFALAAAALALAVIGALEIAPNRNVMAMAKEGTLYRMASGQPQNIPAGEKIERNAVVRSQG